MPGRKNCRPRADLYRMKPEMKLVKVESTDGTYCSKCGVYIHDGHGRIRCNDCTTLVIVHSPIKNLRVCCKCFHSTVSERFSYCRKHLLEQLELANYGKCDWVECEVDDKYAWTKGFKEFDESVS